MVEASGGGDCFTLTLPSRLEYRGVATAMAKAVCLLLEGQEGPFTHQVLSALHEAFNNVILHAYDRRPDQEVRLRAVVLGDRLVLEILDQGRSFDLESVKAPDMGVLPEGGMGVFIIKSSMDEVSYGSAGGWNRLTMVKHLKGDRHA